MSGELKRSVKPWIRPWNMEKFDDLFNRDERYFAVLLKGMLAWFNSNIVMYNKPINHFIFTTGSSYMYIENNGYEFKWNETSGEDWMYMQLPRCVIEFGSLRIPTEELTSPYVRGNYERANGGKIQGFNAQVRRLPIEMDFTFRYYFSNFNESIVFLQEAMDKLLFQKFFRISYLGETIRCSIELPQDFNVQINPIDMASTDPRQRTIELAIKLNSNYPLIDETTEIPTDKVIKTFNNSIDVNEWTAQHPAYVYDENGNQIQVHYSTQEYEYTEPVHNYSDDPTIITDENGNVLDENGNIVEHTVYIKPGTLVDENGNYVPTPYNEFGEKMTAKELIELFNIPISVHSTLFMGDISNTTDIISRDKILK